jgi:predicted transcriptional regulator
MLDKENKKIGRPKSSNPKTELVQFRVPPELKGKLQTLADDKNISMSTLLMLMLDDYIEEKNRKKSINN